MLCFSTMIAILCLHVYRVFILIVVYSTIVYNRDKTDAEMSEHKEDTERDDM